MAVTITVFTGTDLSDNPLAEPSTIRAKKDVCSFAITGSEPNDVSEFNSALYPTTPEGRFYLSFVVNGAEVGRSQVFGTTPDGNFAFNSYIFPVAGTYTVQLYSEKDGALATAKSIVVS